MSNNLFVPRVRHVRPFRPVHRNNNNVYIYVYLNAGFPLILVLLLIIIFAKFNFTHTRPPYISLFFSSRCARVEISYFLKAPNKINIRPRPRAAAIIHIFYTHWGRHYTEDVTAKAASSTHTYTQNATVHEPREDLIVLWCSACAG